VPRRTNVHPGDRREPLCGPTMAAPSPTRTWRRRAGTIVGRCGGIAQLVEHLHGMQRVCGSNPHASTRFFGQSAEIYGLTRLRNGCKFARNMANGNEIAPRAGRRVDLSAREIGTVGVGRSARKRRNGQAPSPRDIRQDSSSVTAQSVGRARARGGGHRHHALQAGSWTVLAEFKAPDMTRRWPKQARCAPGITDAGGVLDPPRLHLEQQSLRWNQG
jgi:hypothetical protein